ncbi:protein C11orf74 homolog [Rhinatrema bivittatum]|uniref:protein C11orf74 homolog n=1 Tax=Rhinatrema bivittatum TaxID=194408 RepID=UPI00112C2538|nr:protein C11orf74 homolog [Rhinatrema bivittatum]
MPVCLSGAFIMDEEEIMQDALNRFINSHEQTYEEFFSSFTHLCRGESEPRDRTCKGESVEEAQAAPKPVVTGGETAASGNGTHCSLADSLPAPDEDQLVLVEGSTAGACHKLRPPGRVRVDNYLNLEDFRLDDGSGWKRIAANDSELLPGEVEEEDSHYLPSCSQCTQLKIRTGGPCNAPSSTALELPGDVVQPFSLDEEFDYDNVGLTPKFSEAEVKVMMEASRLQSPRTVQSQSEEFPDSEA